MTVLDEYGQRVDSNVDSENLLGRLFWYSMSETRVPHADFVKMLTDNNIVYTPPNEPKDVDVYRRVCSNVKRRKVPTADPDVFENFNLVEFKDDETVTRRVVRERVNTAGKKIGFTELFDVVFDRDSGDVVIKGVNGFKFRDNTTPAAIRDEIIDQYYLWRGCLNTYTIREWVRRIIMKMGATMVRPGGGVYFVREAHVPQVDAFEALADDMVDYLLSDHDGSLEFHSLPLIDDRKQREMVQRAFEAESVDAIDSLLTEISAISKSDRKITKDRYADMLGKYQDLVGKTQEYEELLEQKLASTTSRLDIFQRSLLGIRTKVKVDA